MKTTKTRKNTRKPTPDLISKMPRRSKGPAPTASEIANSIEAEAKKLQDLADILNGKS